MGPAKEEEEIIYFHITQSMHYCNINIHIYCYYSGGKPAQVEQQVQTEHSESGGGV